MWPFKSKLIKANPKHIPNIRGGEPNCGHNDWEVIEKRCVGDSSGSVCDFSWGTTRCRICGKKGGWNNR